MNTAKLIENTLEEQGRKKSWLAKKLGKSNSQLSHWFSGYRPIPEEAEKQALETLGIKCDECSHYSEADKVCMVNTIVVLKIGLKGEAPIKPCGKFNKIRSL